MKAFITHGFSIALAMLLAGSYLPAADREQSQSKGSLPSEFTPQGIQREASELKLKLEEGKTYRWDIEARPHQQGGSSSSSGGSKMCKHPAEARVTQSSGQDSTVTFSFDLSQCQFCKEQAQKEGRQPPQKLTYKAKVSDDGKISSFQEEGGGGGGQGAEWKNMFQTQARQLVGEGLHEGRLEPGRPYDVAWMRPEAWQKGGSREPGRVESGTSTGQAPSSGRDGATARAVGALESQRFQLRYDGQGRVEGQQVAAFTVSSGGSGGGSAKSSSGGGESGSSQERQGGSSQAGSSGGGQEAGKATFRVEDGLLERFALILPESLVKEMQKAEGKGQQKPESGGMSGDMLITVRRSGQ